MATQLTHTGGDLLSPEQLRGRLQAVGERRYHHLHPFHLRMNAGELTGGQLQAWALNPYYYQSRIPIKDSQLLAKSDDPAFRRAWRKRIIDHDGDQSGYGGVEKWIQLAEATGLSRDQVIPCTGVLPGVIFAVDAYLALVRDSPLLIAVASSLAGFIPPQPHPPPHGQAPAALPYLAHGLSYFEGRLT